MQEDIATGIVDNIIDNIIVDDKDKESKVSMFLYLNWFKHNIFNFVRCWIELFLISGGRVWGTQRR